MEACGNGQQSAVPGAPGPPLAQEDRRVTAPQDPYAPPPGPGGSAPVGTPASGWSGGYGTPEPAYGTAPVGQARNGLGTAALVLGIVGLLISWLVVGGVLGLVAIGLGIAGLRRVSRREATNRGRCIGGIVLGVLSVLVAAAVAIGGAAFWQNGGKELTSCLQDAGDDQAAVDQCRRDYEEQVGALGR